MVTNSRGEREVEILQAWIQARKDHSSPDFEPGLGFPRWIELITVGDDDQVTRKVALISESSLSLDWLGVGAAPRVNGQRLLEQVSFPDGSGV